MRPPHLNRALVLEAVLRNPDGAGGYVETWAALGTLWAAFSTGSGSDVPGEEQILGAVRYRISVRAAPSGSASRPKAGQRFREGDRVFPILAVAEADPAGRFLTCFAREEVAT